VNVTVARTADQVAPTVSLTAPTGGAAISGSVVAVSATASDNVGVAGVQFKLDGVNLGSEIKAAPYSMSWNTTSASLGNHKLTAVARDGAGNTITSAAVNVMVVASAGDDDNDGIPNGVEPGEGRNPLAKDNDVFGNARLFAMQQYRDFLSREGEAAGITFWTQQLTAGMPRVNVAKAFFDSPEFQGTVSPVARLYFAYFLRIPDYAGLNYWAANYRAGQSLDTISSAFAQSQEFVNTYGSLSDAAFVQLVYQNVLGRAPDEAGRIYWIGQLSTHARTRGQVMLAFSEGPEFRAMIANEVFVTMTYLGMLRREPDQAGFDFWVDSMDRGGSGEALIDGFLRSQEYHNRFLP
jgi:hypothetical protein